MNASVAFAEAARPARAVILHTQMLRYSIGHELILTAENNPLLGDQEQFDKLPSQLQVFAIRRSVQICCRTWRENETEPLSWWFLKRWNWLNRKADYPTEVALFRNYRHEGTTFPAVGKISTDSEDSRPLGAPFMSRMLAFHGTDKMDMPLGLAQWTYFAWAEAEGMCKVLDEDETRIQAELEKIKKHGLPKEESERIEMLKKAAMERNKCQRP